MAQDYGVTISTQTTDELFAGEYPPSVELPITLVSGAGDLTRGHVLGRITKGAASSAAKSGGNTGQGALTLDATTPKLSGAQVGVYTVRCIAASAGGGTFRVTDPQGNVLGDVAVAATFANQIKFSIADGDPDFIVGEGFDITVAAGSGKFTGFDADAVDGSEEAICVLAQDTDASSADEKTVAYFQGNFDADKVSWEDEENDAAAATITLQSRGIFIH